MRFGQDSIAFLKPDENGGLMQPDGEGGAQEDSDGSMVVYDIVDDDRKNNNAKV